MKLPDQIRSLFAVLLKNGLISVDEIAMFRVHREEDKKQMLDIVNRLYENRVVRCGELETTLVSEDDVFMLIDYIADDPISTKENDKDNQPRRTTRAIEMVSKLNLPLIIRKIQ